MNKVSTGAQARPPAGALIVPKVAPKPSAGSSAFSCAVRGPALVRLRGSGGQLELAVLSDIRVVVALLGFD